MVTSDILLKDQKIEEKQNSGNLKKSVEFITVISILKIQYG